MIVRRNGVDTKSRIKGIGSVSRGSPKTGVGICIWEEERELFEERDGLSFGVNALPGFEAKS